jgi:ABC-type antimicrobial peptide transport system permease subunit
MNPYVYSQTTALLILTAFVSALYPALRAIRLKPVEAIRKI